MFFGKKDEEKKIKSNEIKKEETKNKEEETKKEEPEKEEPKKEESSSTDTKVTTKKIKEILGKSGDFSTRELYINGNKELPVTFIFLNGLVDTQKVSQFVLQPLLDEVQLADAKSVEKVIEFIESGSLYYSSQAKRDKVDDVVKDLIDGSAALVFDQEGIAFTFDAKGFERRSIAEPTGENVKKGGKDSFVETLRINTATIRRKIRTPDLVMDETAIGERSRTPVSIIYIDGITNMGIVNEVKKRLECINVDEVLSIGKINEYIIDMKYSLFPQTDYTERPDKFCSDIIEGRVGVIVDGLPFGTIVPAEFGKFFQASEDYSHEPVFATLIRLMRYILFLLTLFLPGFYIAVTTFHPEMIPTELAASIALSKQGVPFPIFIEVIMMLLAFEILLEAGLRLPKSIGQAVSIVGGLVVGEAAVSAKLVSPAVVIIVAIAAIASFTIPNQDFSNAIRIWRLILVILASIMGFFTLTIGAIFLLFILARMETFGIPYLAPYAGTKVKNMSDTFIRLPLYLHKWRPEFLKTDNKKRMGNE